MTIDQQRIQRAVLELLSAIGEDPEREGLVDTPRRVAESYAEFFSGMSADPIAELGDRVPLGHDDPGEIVIVRDITFRSVCEHHLLPFLGIAHVAYLPGDGVVGLGGLARVVEAIAARPQLQERLGDEIACALDSALSPKGVLVVLEARHGCVWARGTRQEGSSTVTVASRGELTDPIQRAEVISLIGAPRE